MSDIDQAALLEIIAGKTRSNTAAAILSNTTDLEEAYVQALEAEGSALEENEKYLDSIQGRIDLFNNAVQTMWNNALDSSVIKWVVDLGTSLIKIIDRIGLINSILLGMGISKFVPFLLKLITHTEKFGSALSIILRPLVTLNGSSKTLLQVFQQVTAESMNAAGGVSTFGSYLKGAGAVLKKFFSTPLGWFTAVIAAISIAIALFDAFTDSVDELREKLEESQSALSDTRSEIKSLNDELDETRKRIEELSLLPSLSFTDAEELERLKQQEESLERQVKLKELLAKSQQETATKDAEEYIDASWDSNKWYDKAYTINSATGAIEEDKWYTNGIDTKDAINKAIDNYVRYQNAEQDKNDILLNWDTYKQQIDDGTIDYETYNKIYSAINSGYKDGNSTNDNYTESYFYDKYLKDSQDLYDKLLKQDSYSDEMATISESIAMVLGDEQYANLEYGMSTEIDKFLDELYAYQLKWKQAQGDYVKSDTISSLFDSTASESMQNIEKEIQEIMNNDAFTSDQKNEQIMKYVDSIDETANGYERLNSAMQIVGITAQDIADYFVLNQGLYDSDTIEGVTAQYTDALNVMRQLQGMNANGTFTIDNTQYNWDEFFSKDDTGKFEANANKFSEILKGMDEDCKKTFMSLAESVKNGELTWNQAISSFSHSGSLAGLEFIAKQISELNSMTFKGLDDEISGVIDTFDEFSAALEDVASSIDLLNTAQTQMNNSGRISIKTALEIISSTDRWNEVLSIEKDNITLNANATEVLVQDKLDLIKANIENEISTLKEQLSVIASKEASDNLAMTIEESTNVAIRDMAGNMAYLTKIMEAYARIANGEIVDIDDYISQAQAAQETAKNGVEVNYKLNQANAAGQENLEKRLADAEARLKMLGQIDSASNFKDYYDYDETPGDKYDEDGDALEKLREKYERKISNLDNQQTYLQNEIDRLEAEDQVVSKSYYEEQIMLEQKKLALYKEELAALKQLEMTDEVADALWEVEHAIQESTMRMVEFRQSIIDLYVDAFDKLIEAYDNKDDFLTDQQDYIDKYRELMELQGEVPSSYGYQEQIANEEEKLAANIAELEDLRAALAEAMANSELQEGDEEWVEMQDKIRDCEAAILDNKIAIEEYRDELKQLSVDAFDIVRDAFGYKDSFLTTQQDYIEGYADYLEALNVDVPTEVYDKLIEIEQQKRENNVADLVSAREQFAEIEAAGYTAADEEWQDAYSTITDLEKKIQDSDIAMAEWAQTIRDMDFEKFDRFIDRLNDINSEIEKLRGLYDDDDVALEDGTWTEEGITSLGLAYQQMELAKQQSQEYAEKIEELNEVYDKGEMSEQEYYERLQELKDGQWDAIDAYESAKDAIVDLEEARIDMIEEGINEEIEAYEELIQLKKDELDAERDLYEFKRDVEKQTKDIATLERRIASLSGSTSASDIAERRKLEAELREAKEGLNDTYYSHAKDQQSQALDDELEAYQEAKENYLETLREALEDTEKIISEKINEVLMNADVVLEGINKTAGEYGVTLSSSLMLPWQQAAQESLAFKATIDENLPILNSTITLFNDDVKAKFEAMFAASGTAAQTFNTAVSTVISNIRTVVENASSPLTANLRYPWENLTSADGPINTFSTKSSNAINTALQTAQNKAASMTSALTSPWNAGSNAANTFSTNISRVLDDAVTKARSAYSQISSYANLSYASYEGISDTASKITNTNPTPTATKRVTATASVNANGKDFSKTVTLENETDVNKAKTRALSALQSEVINYMSNTKMSTDEAQSKWEKMWAKKVTYSNVKQYAKGTIGTNKDQWAITDEPWLGNELTMYATKQGTLSYMRAGSTVIPADLTKELIEIGEIGVDGLTMPKINSGVNLMSNYISKPEINLTFDALVKADKITEDTLPEVKKFVKQEINSLVKQMNYALKGVGGR